MFKEKVAVVTGGASGIGLATTKKLLSEGANVIILDLKMDEEIINSLGENVLYLKCDVSNEENVKNCIEEIIKKFDHIDYLVANAGIGGSASKPHEVSMDEWNKVISVNQTGIFLLNKYVINEMLKNGKGAINQMTRSLALTYARDNIRVNAIAPGYVDTPILSMVPDNIKEAMGNELPIGRLGKDTEIANLICYLLSDDASFITGAIIPIDGGFTAK